MRWETSNPTSIPEAFRSPAGSDYRPSERGSRSPRSGRGAVLRGDGAGIAIGARTSIQDNAVIHNTDELRTVVGNDVTDRPSGSFGRLHYRGRGAYRRCFGRACTKRVVGRGALVGASAVVTNQHENSTAGFGHWSAGQDPRGAHGRGAESRGCSGLCGPRATDIGLRCAYWADRR